VRRLTLIFAVAALLFCGMLADESRANSVQLDALAARLTGVSDARIDCYAGDGVDGGYVWLTSENGAQWVWTEGHTIYLDGEFCGALQNVLTPGPHTKHWEHTDDGKYALGAAMMTLEHEVTHVRLLSIDEGLVECTAYRNVWQDVKVLPLSRRMQKIVYAYAAQSHKDIHDPEYRSVC
jgi:hypothetical protein